MHRESSNVLPEGQTVDSGESDNGPDCNCAARVAPYLDHSPFCRGLRTGSCGVMQGDGSIPGPTCILAAGHLGAHYG